MKTLKTHLVEAILNYLYSNDKIPHIKVNWKILDQCDGEIPNLKRDGDEVVLNINTSAIANFDITRNTVYFNCRFGGIDSACVIPTAAISVVFGKLTGEGMVFNAEADYAEEQLQNNTSDKNNDEVKEEPKPKNNVSHLRVIK